MRRNSGHRLRPQRHRRLRGGRGPATALGRPAWPVASKRPGGPWTDVAMTIDREITLRSQKRAKEWEYRVNAVNKAGEGEPSNTVMAVL